MKKKNSLFVAMASVMLATSCSTDDLQSGGALSNSQIGVHPTIGKVDTRAAETTTANLSAFKTFSFLTDDSKNYMDGVTYSNASGEWTTDAGTFFWPVTGDLNFYSYAPENPGSEGEVTVDPSQQKITGFVPYTTAATQQDLIYSKATGNLAQNGTSGIDLNFEHALSEITVSAKNDNAAYTVEVSGVKLGNITSKGDFTFPTIAGDAASWTLGEDKADYTTEWESATTLSSTVSSLDASNTAFMLIPQQLEAETRASDGNYIALKVKITMQGGQVIHDGWAYVAVPTIWEMGKHYAYTLDFTSGAGQDVNGNDIISGTDVTLKVNVTPWDEEEYNVPSYIFGKNTDAETFTIEINETEVPVTMSSDGTWKYDLGGKKITSLKNTFTAYPHDSKIEYLNLAGLNTSEVTSMMSMLKECTFLKNLDVSSFDTHNVTDISYMFESCTSLASLNLLGWNTSNVTNMRSMFRYCSSLTSLDLSNFNTSNVTDMVYMFDDCSSLTSLDLSGWNTSNVTDMGNMFENCSSLETLDLSSFNTSNVTDMGNMFYSCENITALDLSNFNTSNVKYMGYMFCRCLKLKSLDLSKFDTSNVTNMQYMFWFCKNITALDLSNFNTSNVTNMHSMFSGCSSLETLDLSSFNTSNVTNMDSMFDGCSSLETLDLSGWDLSNVTSFNMMFFSCKELKTIYLVGCNENTINKIKQGLAKTGLSTDIIRTTRN